MHMMGRYLVDNKKIKKRRETEKTLAEKLDLWIFNYKDLD